MTELTLHEGQRIILRRNVRVTDGPKDVPRRLSRGWHGRVYAIKDDTTPVVYLVALDNVRAAGFGLGIECLEPENLLERLAWEATREPPSEAVT